MVARWPYNLFGLHALNDLKVGSTGYSKLRDIKPFITNMKGCFLYL